MGWSIFVQPNCKYARFSSVVDNVTDFDMTRDDAFVLCRDLAGSEIANEKLKMADADAYLSRFRKVIERIRAVHGDDEAEHVRGFLSGEWECRDA